MSVHSERLAEVVAATVEVAAESGSAGVFTDDVAQALAAVVGKVADRAVDAAELSGFVSGWQEALGAVGDDASALAQVVRMASRGGMSGGSSGGNTSGNDFSPRVR
ncbi:hypothetical protein AB0I49_06035 [Streptomyces sp. NPDC050617]|uniref:hypothetical protein n=1 Tax=Streptomyces sp. NPDC050617 TaxID=3154628 RepID=UPI0034304CC0